MERFSVENYDLKAVVNNNELHISIDEWKKNDIEIDVVCD